MKTSHSRTSGLRTVCVAVIVAACAIGASAQTAPPPVAVDAGTPQLAAEWWQWALSFSDADSPITDLGGERCAAGQRGNVWFLAGGYGDSRIRRTCRVPAGKTLFFPIINMVYYPTRGATGLTCDAVRRAAALHNDAVLKLFAEVDGRSIDKPEGFRMASEACFDIFERRSTMRRPSNGFPSATDGYWLRVPPLAPGRHRLKFGGSYQARNGTSYDNMRQDIEYEVWVDEAPTAQVTR